MSTRLTCVFVSDKPIPATIPEEPTVSNNIWPFLTGINNDKIKETSTTEEGLYQHQQSLQSKPMMKDGGDDQGGDGHIEEILRLRSELKTAREHIESLTSIQKWAAQLYVTNAYINISIVYRLMAQRVVSMQKRSTFQSYFHFSSDTSSRAVICEAAVETVTMNNGAYYHFTKSIKSERRRLINICAISINDNIILNRNHTVHVLSGLISTRFPNPILHVLRNGTMG